MANKLARSKSSGLSCMGRHSRMIPDTCQSQPALPS